jgi:Cof subfamily protein (haloacid dehalogenase superfamily)
MIRLIAIDIDGTLLRRDRTIHPENVRAIREAQAAGVEVVLATGRIRPSMEPFATQLGLGAGPRICCNGAQIVGRDGATLLELGLDDEVRDAVLDFSEENELHLNAYLADRLLFTSEDEWAAFYRKRTRLPEPELVSVADLRRIPVLKLMLIAEPERLVEVNPLLRKRLEPHDVRVTESEPEYLEFLAPEADKGTSLARLSALLGVERAEVAAIGDYLNDLEMVRWAGVGAAVANGAAELKAEADVVAPSNDEGGVAWFIRQILAGKQLGRDSQAIER